MKIERVLTTYAAIMYCIICLFALVSCHNASEHVNTVSNWGLYSYNERFKCLYINSCQRITIPDSIVNKDIKHLYIDCLEHSESTCSYPIDYNGLFGQVDGSSIYTVQAYSLLEPDYTFEFGSFPKLRSARIGGSSERVKNINLKDLNDSLWMLELSAPNLEFPLFDSAFLNLAYFWYHGNSTTIPKWLENLHNLTSFTFISPALSVIECDICKMDKIRQFEVVESEVADKHKHLQDLKIFPEIEKFQKCKPDLDFWRSLPPH